MGWTVDMDVAAGTRQQVQTPFTALAGARPIVDIGMRPAPFPRSPSRILPLSHVDSVHFALCSDNGAYGNNTPSRVAAPNVEAFPARAGDCSRQVGFSVTTPSVLAASRPDIGTWHLPAQVRPSGTPRLVGAATKHLAHRARGGGDTPAPANREKCSCKEVGRSQSIIRLAFQADKSDRCHDRVSAEQEKNHDDVYH
jgi:hypothetical protein